MEPAVKNQLLDKQPPHNLEAEMSVLGSMMLDKQAIGAVIEKRLTSECFYRDVHKKIFSTIIFLYEKNAAIDLVTLAEELKKSNSLDTVGGVVYLTDLLNSVPTSANAEYYAAIVLEKALLRDLIRTATNVVSQCYNPPERIDALLDTIEKQLFDITQRRITEGFVRIRDLIGDSIEKAEKLSTREDTITGVPTGFIDLDNMTSGLQNADMIVVAGRPSMGKTTIALNIAEHAAVKHNLPVAIFSLEMSKEQLVLRMLCSYARVNWHRVRTGFLGEKDFPNLVSAANSLSKAPIFIDDTPGITALEIKAKARQLMSRHDLRLIVVDYLQLMQASSRRIENRQQEISEMSRALKSLARELRLPVIVISQLNRAVETRAGNRPQLSDLRESGAIEQDADVVMLLLREDYYQEDKTQHTGLADCIIAKQRNGPVGDIKLAFLEEYTRFENCSKEVYVN